MKKNILIGKRKLHYNESSQAGNKLKFKKDLLNEFPQLKQKRSHFVYEMQYFRDPKDFEELLLKLRKGVNILIDKFM